MNYSDGSTSKREADIWDLIAIIWAKKLWILLSIVVFTGVFTAAAFMITPVYRATTVLVPVSSTRNSISSSLSSVVSQLGGVASLAGLTTSDSNTEEALAVLQSREFTERFISDRNLLSELRPRKWHFGKSRPPTLGKGFEYFDKEVRTITQDKKTGLITVQIDWKNRYEAADWANDLVARLNSEMRARAIENANNSLNYLEAELKKTPTVPTQEAINRLIEEQVKQRMLANVTKEYVFRVADRALPPDADEPESPKIPMLVGGGIMLGFVFGVLCIFAADSFSRSRRVGRQQK